MMYEPEKSDPSIVAVKPANNSGPSEAESMEPREGAEGSTREPHTHRTRSRASVSPGLERVRERARQEKKERFTALLHHVSVDLLRTAYSRLKRDAAPGVDGMTWREYGQDLEARLVDLHPTGCGFPNPVEIVFSPLKAMNFNQDWHQDRDH